MRVRCGIDSPFILSNMTEPQILAEIEILIAAWRETSKAFRTLGLNVPYEVARIICQLEILRDKITGKEWPQLEKKSAEIIPFKELKKRARG